MGTENVLLITSSRRKRAGRTRSLLVGAPPGAREIAGHPRSSTNPVGIKPAHSLEDLDVGSLLSGFAGGLHQTIIAGLDSDSGRDAARHRRLTDTEGRVNPTQMRYEPRRGFDVMSQGIVERCGGA